MPEQDVTSPETSQWVAILERRGHGDQQPAVDERRLEEHRLWQASLKRRDDAIAELELVRAETVEREHQPRPEPAFDAPLRPISGLGPLDDEEVRYAGEMGRWIPQFEYYSPLRRRIAKMMSRGILFLTGFISVHQRRYNHLVLDKMAATQERLDQTIDALNRVQARLGDLEQRFQQRAEQELEVVSEVDALRRNVHGLRCEVLSQTVEVADLQAERLERRMRDLDEL